MPLYFWFYRYRAPGPASQASTLLRAAVLGCQDGVSGSEGTGRAVSRPHARPELSGEGGRCYAFCPSPGQQPLLPLRLTKHWSRLLLSRRKSACLRAGRMRAFLVVQGLRLCASTTGYTGLIPVKFLMATVRGRGLPLQKRKIRKDETTSLFSSTPFLTHMEFLKKLMG